MNRKQAENLLVDLRKSLGPKDFCEDVYLSIQGIGSKTFKSCSYFESESWLFIWTREESFVFSKKEVGDFVFVPGTESVINIKKEKSCY
jgi:hypothetical protein